jgi:type IV pilus assembly protein PilC
MNFSAQVTLFDRVRFVDKLLFTKHLAVMIKSGIPIGDAIDAIAQQTQNAAFKKLLNAILADIDNGQSFEKALSKHPKVFDAFYINVISIGEQSGTLEKNLEYLADQLKKNYEFSKKVHGALLYPTIVLTIAFIAGGSISIFVLPQLVDLFSSLDVELPLATKILLFIATTMRDYGILIGIGFVGLLFALKMLITVPRVKWYWDQILLSMPGLGPFLRDVEIAFLCRNVGIMLKSGLTITAALNAQHNATTNLIFKKYINDLSVIVDKGQPIAEKLTPKAFPHIPQLVPKMLGVGEKTGKLDESFLYLGDFFSDEVDNYSKNLSTLIEPVILIGIGLVVAFVALAVISPIYQLTTGIHR